DSLLSHNLLFVYTVLFILIFLENTIPFVPGDAVLIFSAYLSGQGSFYPIPIYLITVLGSLAGFVFVFFLSRHWRRDLYKKMPFRISPEKTRKYKTLFQRHENWSLVIGRIVPGSRLFLSATAGFMDISITKALILTSVGVLIWNSIIFRSGMLLGEHWEIIKKGLAQYSTIVNVILIIMILVVIVWKIYLPILRKKHG
ncbi:MAG: DedA family protein, partial [Candidatus Marinimicrobia bacterium]|nr:DedA family protein [Candidatus Neomarinimicrobiota bacterium]